MDLNKLKFDKAGGLIPVIVQDDATNIVLMQAWMNREALDQTVETQKLTFFSRSRNRLWTKGETSGNFLFLKKIWADCDQDCLLAKVVPAGPACHTGEDTCFGEENPSIRNQEKGGNSDDDSLGFLGELERLLEGRKTADPSKSYTAKLFGSGTKRIAKKVGEEAVELILEAENGDQQRFIEEAADLLYHMNVLLIAREMGWKDVVKELQSRHQTRQ